jgi:hypothetical protein
MRFLTTLGLVTGVLVASSAYAQAPPAGPLVLRLPATPRTAALGNAWVAGRDQEVLFYNPAQLIGARTGFDVSFARYGPSGKMATLGSVFTAGRWSLTLGWGVEMLRFGVDPGASYPFAPDVVLSSGPAQGVSAVVAVGGAIVYKRYRIGAAGKYAFDSVPAASGVAGTASPHQGAMLADLGVAKNLWGGVAAVSVQNLGHRSRSGSGLVIPKQVLMGWSMTHGAGPLDLGVVTQFTLRDGWTFPGAGLEVGYSWIEGYNIALRVGARRPDSPVEKPVAFGAAFTADRLTVEYSLQLFDGGRTANGVTLRWR